MTKQKTKEIVEETTINNEKETANIIVEKQYIGGKEIISSVEINATTRRVIDIDGTTYLEPIE